MRIRNLGLCSLILVLPTLVFSRALAAFPDASFDVKSFQSNSMSDADLLVEFNLGDEQSYLLLVSKNSVESLLLPPREQIEGRVQRLLQILKDHQSRSGEEIQDYEQRVASGESEYARGAQALSNELLG